MSILLIMAIIFMTLALVFYTIGVFAEKKSGSLLKWHALIFWLGFICDTSERILWDKYQGTILILISTALLDQLLYF